MNYFIGFFISCKLDCVLMKLEHLEKRMTKEFDNVKAAVDALKADVAAEIQQLADALAVAAAADKPADIQAVADALTALSNNLKADDVPPVA